MTNQIAPSLATELEQAAQKCRDEIASCFADYVEAAREDGRDDAVSEHAKCSGCHSQRTHEALLTRAAALARAAEKVEQTLAFWNVTRIAEQMEANQNYATSLGDVFIKCADELEAYLTGTGEQK